LALCNVDCCNSNYDAGFPIVFIKEIIRDVPRFISIRSTTPSRVSLLAAESDSEDAGGADRGALRDAKGSVHISASPEIASREIGALVLAGVVAIARELIDRIAQLAHIDGLRDSTCAGKKAPLGKKLETKELAFSLAAQLPNPSRESACVYGESTSGVIVYSI